uniref:Large ribosomal subunit protein bL34m n=1 Tax=Chrysemys picta bellii TaxID=8478 RepID=A0A8C3HEE0_CHRPI
MQRASWRARKMSPVTLRPCVQGSQYMGFFLLQRVAASPSQPRTISILSDALGQPPSTSLSFRSAGIFQSIPRHLSPWSLQQIRTKARGNEYQPKNLKRKRTHGWIKRIRTPSGIEVILRRMLKGRKSLSH